MCTYLMWSLLCSTHSLHIGIEKLRFKPAYNPYTEPSMEVFSYHEGDHLHMYTVKTELPKYVLVCKMAAL